MEKRMDVLGINTRTSTYRIDRDHLEKARDLEPKQKATEIANATKHYLKNRQTTNPRYQRVSQRIDELLGDWRTDRLDDSEVATALEEVEKRALAVREQRNELGMHRAEYAIYTLLIDEYNVDENEAIAIAAGIFSEFEKVDTGFDGWHMKERIKKKIRQGVIRTLIVEYDRKDLYDREDILEEIVEYLIQNERMKTSSKIAALDKEIQEGQVSISVIQDRPHDLVDFTYNDTALQNLELRREDYSVRRLHDIPLTSFLEKAEEVIDQDLSERRAQSFFRTIAGESERITGLLTDIRKDDRFPEACRRLTLAFDDYEISWEDNAIENPEMNEIIIRARSFEPSLFEKFYRTLQADSIPFDVHAELLGRTSEAIEVGRPDTVLYSSDTSEDTI